jgi:hypothetical protein
MIPDYLVLDCFIFSCACAILYVVLDGVEMYRERVEPYKLNSGFLDIEYYDLKIKLIENNNKLKSYATIYVFTVVILKFIITIIVMYEIWYYITEII